MIIRPPKFRELPLVVEMGRMMHAEGEFKFVPFDEDWSYFQARDALEKYHDGEAKIIAIAEHSDKTICGFLIGALAPYIFSPARYASDLAVFVVPEKRGTSAAVRMIKAFEDWAKMHNAVEFSFGVSTGVQIEKTHAFYNKLGYTHVGGVFKKKNTGGEA